MTITIKDIARHFGVSTATISRAFRNSGYVNAKLRAAIIEYAHARHWQPSRAAAELVTGRNHTVAFVVNTLSNIENARILSGMTPGLRAQGYHIFVSQYLEEDGRLAELASYLERRPDAVAAFPLDRRAAPLVRRLMAEGTRVVAIGCRLIPGVAGALLDYEGQGYMAMEHLIRQGRRRILYFGLLGDQRRMQKRGCNFLRRFENPVERRRLLGAVKAAQAHGVPFDYTRDAVSDYGGDSSLREKLKRNYSGLVCSAPRLLAAAYRLCHAAGQRIPDRLAIVGIGYHPMLAGYQPAPMVVDIQAERLGQEIGRVITAPKFEVRDVVISPVLRNAALA